MELFLVRHGECKSNVLLPHETTILDSLDGLTEQGSREAKALACHFQCRSNDPRTRIFSSSSTRAVETANKIAGLGIHPVLVDDRLDERRLCSENPLTAGALKQLFAASHADPEFCDQIEPATSHLERAGDWLRSVVGESESIIAVCHGGTIDMLMISIAGAPPSSASHIHFELRTGAYHRLTRRAESIGGSSRHVWLVNEVNILPNNDDRTTAG